MTTAVLDSLSNLNLSTESLNSLVQSILERLSSATTEELPVIIKFLLQSARDENAEMVNSI